MDALMPTVVRATTLLLAAFLTACTTTPAINTVSVPQAALEVRPVPVLEGTSNRAVGLYASECRAALDKREDDIEAIRKAVAP